MTVATIDDVRPPLKKHVPMTHTPLDIHRNKRRGMALVMVILLLTVTSLILGTMVQELILGHRQFSLDARAAQTRWQADAGLQFASLQLEEDALYAGEDWSATNSPLIPAGFTQQTWETHIRITPQGDGKQITVLSLNRPLKGPEIRVRRELFWKTPHSSLSALEAENSQP